MENEASKFLSFFGINTEKKRSIRNIDEKSFFIVPYESIYIIVEPKGQDKFNYLFFLDLNSIHYYNSFGEHGKIKIYKESEGKYRLLENNKDFISTTFGNNNNSLSQNFIETIIKNISEKNNQNLFQANPYTYSEKEGKESSEVYEKFLSKNFVFLWGTRDLKKSEKAKILMSTGEFKPKKPNSKISGKGILKKMTKDLSLQEDVVKLLFNQLNFHQILAGAEPINGGIVLYGPGGTGKTTIMKVISEIFIEMGAYVAKNTENKFLKTSEVKDTKYYGAYTDYFEPKFAKALQEARIRGIPSLIPIDEGDIFIRDNKKEKNGHSSDMINFWKGHVGNYSDFIVIVASNVLKNELNEIAVRAERAVAVEIPLPNIEISKKLILQFINFYNITLDKEFTDKELNSMAKIIVENKKPGANIAGFCKNFYSKVMDYTNQYLNDKTTDEIVKQENLLRQEITKKKDFISRFENEILNFNIESPSSNKDLDELVSKTEQELQYLLDINPPNAKVMADIERVFKFSAVLKDFYLLTKSNIYTNFKENSNSKIRYYEFLFLLIKKLPNYFNNRDYWRLFSQKFKKENSLELFFQELFNKLIESENENFTKIFEKILNNFDANSNNQSKNNPKDDVNIIEGQIVEEKGSKKDEEFINEIEKRLIWLENCIKVLDGIYNKRNPNNLNLKEFNTDFNNNLDFIFNNIKYYLRLKNKKMGFFEFRRLKEKIRNLKLLINNWYSKKYITPTIYPILINNLKEIINLKNK